ncbi:MAG: PepSY domain-containing protein [Tissierellia bacterium]|nr:PepSY domain-containing protein [Tissierellia bacterium]
MNKIYKIMAVVLVSIFAIQGCSSDVDKKSKEDANIIEFEEKNEVKEELTKKDEVKEESNDLEEGRDKALKVALKDAGVEKSEIIIEKNKYKKKDNEEYFDIEFTVGNKEYEYEIYTDGSIKSKEIDTDDDAKILEANPDLLSQDELKKIVLDEAGVKESDINEYEFEYDEDDGRVVYEVEFIYQNKEYEYKVDASTGEIIEMEIE